MNPSDQANVTARYVAAVIAALYLAGMNVVETWTEPTVPLSYYVRLHQGHGGYVVDLLFDTDDGWTLIYHPKERAPYTHCERMTVSRVADVVTAATEILARNPGTTGRLPTGRAALLQPGATQCSAHLADPHWRPRSTARASSPAGLDTSA